MYEYNVTRYNHETRECSQFAGYIDTFLKMKLESFGYLIWVRTPADEERYIKSFCKSEGIWIDRVAIECNPTKPGMAKLFLNSTWSKLTERNDRTQTKIINEPHELYRFQATPGIEVTNLAFASDDGVCRSWKVSAEENMANQPHTNEVIGAYVPAGARIHLHSFLDRLQENVVYCDTDSVTLIRLSEGPCPIATGESWGTCILN